ncbi:hypothetical protein NDU88_000659 [Pleurodeles waltl]|uniref:Uncharacterized protein n=1 Tax=Pleurodeles waltl TaxID=8319 RepID=A0AAV7UQM2_PLEWA|nr:hypothetical protein NDU88_000659 [Pleurodeles waltl]
MGPRCPSLLFTIAPQGEPRPDGRPGSSHLPCSHRGGERPQKTPPGNSRHQLGAQSSGGAHQRWPSQAHRTRRNAVPTRYRPDSALQLTRAPIITKSKHEPASAVGAPSLATWGMPQLEYILGLCMDGYKLKLVRLGSMTLIFTRAQECTCLI